MPAKRFTMSVTGFRVAKFLKMVSMFMVFGSLIYFYAYVEDRLGFLTNNHDWFVAASKSMIFYTGLGIFSIFNLMMGLSINVYNKAQGYNENSLLFKSESQKERIHFWLIYITASINFLIECGILYLAMIRINGMSSKTDYIFLPVFGLLAILISMIGLLLVFTKK